MSRITSHDRSDINRAAGTANKSVEYVGTNRVRIDGEIKYGRNQAMDYLKR